MSKTHEGYFLIADITGYTQYLNESELEHAQETLTALLEMLVKNTRPPLVISRLAGDAIISYGFRDSFFHGQAFVEKIEDTYVVFRKTIERLVLNNTCRCNACANIPNLDLKFFIHFGAFGIQRISDHDELVGSDINLLHRLLKNSVMERTGVKAYALFTAAAIQQLGVTDLVEGMTAHAETYEHLGKVQVWVQDMQPVWEQKRGGVTVTFPADQLYWRHEIDIHMPREQAWDYLIQPKFRNTLIGSDKMEIANRVDGRIGPGSEFQCYHGDKVVPQTVLEWQPFESMIVEELSPMTPGVNWLAEYRVDSMDGGTRLTRSFTKPTGPLAGRIFIRLMSPLFNHFMKRLEASFVQQIEADYQERSETPISELNISEEHIRQAAAAGLQASSSDP